MTARRIALAALAIACACKPHPGAMKRADDAPASSTAVDPLGDAESRIADNAAKMRALGIELAQTREQKPDAPPTAEPPQPEPTKPAPETELEEARRKQPPSDPRPPVVAPEPVTPAPPSQAPSPATKQSGETDRCAQICELADVACGLEQQVCRLADLHVGEPRYEDACWRARDQCERGRDACDECSAAC